MCRTWPLAVSQIPTIPEKLQLCSDDWICMRVQWDAPVLLSSLSPKFVHASVPGSSFRAPGLAAFLGAARQLKVLNSYCGSMVDAAYADYLLGGCTSSSIKQMTNAGEAYPNVYQPSLEHLWAYLESQSQLQAAWGDVFVLHLAQLQHLRRLDIRPSTVLQLGCRVQLPREVMTIHSRLCELESTLRGIPHDELYIQAAPDKT